MKCKTCFSCLCISQEGGTSSCKQLSSVHIQLSMRTGLCLGLRHSNHSKRYSDASSFYVNGWCVCQSVLERVKEGFTCHMRTAALYQQLSKQLRFIMIRLNILEFLKAFVCTIILQQSLKYIMHSLLSSMSEKDGRKREKKGRKKWRAILRA